jgi:hypothetical protein
MKTSIQLLHWTPRILCIVAILFVSLFALDAFAFGLTIWQQLAGFLKHLIPSYILLAFLVIAWKYEYIGGLIFAIMGLGFSPFIFLHNYQMNHSVCMSLIIILMITFPFVVVGLLFILSHFMKKKNLQNTGL